LQASSTPLFAVARSLSCWLVQALRVKPTASEQHRASTSGPQRRPLAGDDPAGGTRAELASKL